MLFTQGDGVTEFTGRYLKTPFYTDYWTEDGYAVKPTIISGKIYYA